MVLVLHMKQKGKEFKLSCCFIYILYIYISFHVECGSTLTTALWFICIHFELCLLYIYRETDYYSLSSNIDLVDKNPSKV